ncbi:hypothetical protein QVD17_35353 [Tagetes erecta]|uniref:Uncharacterized protein n=1 Tax=Tagetes erecta TaxID=13708 RepID=A0AAD8K3F1_TARER|nr:hypothetical protein QVD17_35353 [Tagetes erecta]
MFLMSRSEEQAQQPPPLFFAGVGKQIKNTAVAPLSRATGKPATPKPPCRNKISASQQINPVPPLRDVAAVRRNKIFWQNLQLRRHQL